MGQGVGRQLARQEQLAGVCLAQALVGCRQEPRSHRPVLHTCSSSAFSKSLKGCPRETWMQPLTPPFTPPAPQHPLLLNSANSTIVALNSLFPIPTAHTPSQDTPISHLDPSSIGALHSYIPCAIGGYLEKHALTFHSCSEPFHGSPLLLEPRAESLPVLRAGLPLLPAELLSFPGTWVSLILAPPLKHSSLVTPAHSVHSLSQASTMCRHSCFRTPARE